MTDRKGLSPAPSIRFSKKIDELEIEHDDIAITFQNDSQRILESRMDLTSAEKLDLNDFQHDDQVWILESMPSVQLTLESIQDTQNDGNEYLAQGDTMKSIDRFTRAMKAIQKLDDYVDHQSLHGQLCESRSSAFMKLDFPPYGVIVQDCNNVIKFDPNNFKILHRRATAYSQMEDYDAALKDVNTIIENDKKMDYEPSFEILKLRDEIIENVEQDGLRSHSNSRMGRWKMPERERSSISSIGNHTPGGSRSLTRQHTHTMDMIGMMKDKMNTLENLQVCHLDLRYERTGMSSADASDNHSGTASRSSPTTPKTPKTPPRSKSLSRENLPSPTAKMYGMLRSATSGFLSGNKNSAGSPTAEPLSVVKFAENNNNEDNIKISKSVAQKKKNNRETVKHLESLVESGLKISTHTDEEIYESITQKTRAEIEKKEKIKTSQKRRCLDWIHSSEASVACFLLIVWRIYRFLALVGYFCSHIFDNGIIPS